MRLFISGSAPLLAETHREFEDRTGMRILERYGMTETNMNHLQPLRGRAARRNRRLSPAGRQHPRVRSRNRQHLPNGEIGVIEVKGRNVFSGYWRMPEKTAEDFRADGYFITGDLAVMR